MCGCRCRCLIVLLADGRRRGRGHGHGGLELQSQCLLDKSLLRILLIKPSTHLKVLPLLQLLLSRRSTKEFLKSSRHTLHAILIGSLPEILFRLHPLMLDAIIGTDLCFDVFITFTTSFEKIVAYIPWNLELGFPPTGGTGAFEFIQGQFTLGKVIPANADRRPFRDGGVVAEDNGEGSDFDGIKFDTKLLLGSAHDLSFFGHLTNVGSVGEARVRGGARVSACSLPLGSSFAGS
jgi:hypothetical protein